MFSLAEARAAGGMVQPDLAHEIRRLAGSPLCEDAGESYHKWTHRTKLTASGSRNPWILASTRHGDNLQTCLEFARGSALMATVYRFEWLNFKRILRATTHRGWQPLRISDRAFFRRIYKLEPDTDDWARVVSKSAPATSPAMPNIPAIKYDWTRRAMRPGSYYSVPVRQEVVGDDGGVASDMVDSFFKIVATSQDGRLKTVPTSVHDDEEVLQDSRIAVNMQHIDVWRRDGDCVTAFFETDPTWVNTLDIADWKELLPNLKKWECKCSETPGCIELFNPVRVHQLYTVTDLECPVAVKLWVLQRSGWISVNGKVVHTADKKKSWISEVLCRRANI